MKSVLLVRNDRLGDLILSLPCGEALKEAWPDCRVSVLAAAPYAELLRGLPWVSSVVEDGPRKTLRALTEELRVLAPEATLFLYPRPRTAWAAFRARLPSRVGPLGRWYAPLFSRRLNLHRSRYDRHEADYNLDLVRALGLELRLQNAHIPSGEKDREGAARRLSSAGLGGSGALVLLHPGSGGSSPGWSPENFGALAQGLQALGLRVGFTAGPGEEGLAARASAGKAPVFSGLRLPELAALCARASVLVAGSTGVLHLASAAGAKVLGLYSGLPASTPRRWGPLGPGRVLVAKKAEDPNLETITTAEASAAVHELLR